MIRGIKLKHGVCFVEYDGVTVRINTDGTCVLSRVLLPSLEWELRTEPPETWDYISDSDIDAYGEETRRALERIVEKYRRVLEN